VDEIPPIWPMPASKINIYRDFRRSLIHPLSTPGDDLSELEGKR